MKHSLTGLQHWCRGDIQDFEGLTDLWITHAQAVATTEDQIKTKLRVFSSVIFRTLLYGLQCTVLLEPEVHRLQSFVMRCLHTILSISTWDNKRNTSIRKTAKQQRVSSLLSQRRLRLVGHLTHMDESPLPCQLLVSALPSGKRSVGGQKCR